VVCLVLPYMTAYQLLHRVARAQPGDTVLVHGAAGRVGVAILELGAAAGLRLYGTAAAKDRATIQNLGAVAIDYQAEDFLARMRALPGKGADVVLDGIGGPLSVRSFRALRPGGRLVVFGHYLTLSQGRKSRMGWLKWYVATAAVAAAGLLSPRRRVLAYRVQKVHRHARPLAAGGGPRVPEWYRDDFQALLDLLRRGKIHPVVAGRLPLAEARQAHELLEQTAEMGKLVLVPEGAPGAA
jgi:NADPH:quinone reductase-like Zn-dependent oxidoreductase